MFPVINSFRNKSTLCPPFFAGSVIRRATNYTETRPTPLKTSSCEHLSTQAIVWGNNAVCFKPNCQSFLQIGTAARHDAARRDTTRHGVVTRLQQDLWPARNVLSRKLLGTASSEIFMSQNFVWYSFEFVTVYRGSWQKYFHYLNCEEELFISRFC